MGKPKYRVAKPYVGHRRNTKRNTKMSAKGKTIDESLGHQREANAESEKPSSSLSKLSFYGFTLDTEVSKAGDENEQVNDCNLFAQFSCLQQFFGKLECRGCHSSGSIAFTFDEERECGFAKFGILECKKCQTIIHEDFLCKRVGNSKSRQIPFEINLLSTLAFRGIGSGHSAMKDWSGTMNMTHCLSQDAYRGMNSKLNEAGKDTFQSISVTTHKKIVEEYSKIGIFPDDDGILDIDVSFDGSWQKRGHSSHNGVASVIDVLTGLVVDYEILSNYCAKCKIAEANGFATNEWKEKHAPNCLKNYDGSANSMEAECAKRLWSRSVDKFKLRYMTMLCDGDSKSYDAVSSAEMYGPQKPITKEDCINHVSKRMGTALQKLVSSSKVQGESLSGKGKLTKVKIMKIQNYYGRAVKDNADDIELLKKRIFAILFHLTSSDDHPKHVHCPLGEQSWCFWQRDVANKRRPGSHKEHETLPAEIGKKLVPIFQRLSDEQLLRRCLRAKTQNSNESFHNVIWKLCPKTVYVGMKTIETGVTLAACQFNMGATFKSLLCKVLGIEQREHMEVASKRKSKERIINAEKAHCEASKKRRKQLKFKNANVDTKRKEQEGTTYNPGGFN